MELTSRVVGECVDKVQSEEAKAIIIPEVSVGKGFWAKCKALEKECYIGDETIEVARFFRKEILFKFDGYDEEITGQEDWDLPFRMRKAGYGISRIGTLIKHHDSKLSLWNSMKKKYYYAQTITKYIEKHPDMARKQLTLLRLAFIRNWRKLAKDPIHTGGMLFMKFGEFAVGGLGYLNTKQERKIVDPREDGILRLVRINSDILNVGCADNIKLHRGLAEKSNSIIGIDIDEKELKKFEKKGYNVKKMNAEKLSFKRKFDIIVAGELIEHLSNPGNFLRSAKKLLKKNGVIIISTPNMQCIPRYFYFLISQKLQNPTHVAWYDIETLKVLLKRFGLKISEYEYAPPHIKTLGNNFFKKIIYLIGTL